MLAAMAITAGLLPSVGAALEFRHEPTGLEGLFDFEAAYGLRLRTQDTDRELVSIAHGGTRNNSGNFDDGTLNYDRGDLVSNMVRGTGELTLRWGNFGAFFRGYGFYDYENEENDRERTELTAEGKEQVGSDARMLDAYLSAKFTLRGRPIQLRLGEQVVNWGESRFFASGGVNVTNALDVPLFQQPTSTLRDLRRPAGMLWGAAHVAPLVVLEAYYQYDWDKTVLPAVGTYFGTNDALSPGGRINQTTGIASQFGTDLSQLFGIPADTLEAVGIEAFDPDFYQIIRRIDADRPSDSGQFGLTLRTIVPWLNDSKFALHYANYHSKIPQFGAITPSVDAYMAYTVQAIGALAEDLVAEGVEPETALSTAGQVQADRFQIDAQYFLQYPEDVQMLGFSFNTTSRRTGTAYFGEIAHHFDAPLALHTGDQLDQALPNASRDNPLPPIDLDTVSEEEIATQYANKRLDSFIELDRTFVIAGATQFFGPQLGAAQAVINLEIGFLHVWDMPSRSDLLLYGPGLALAEFNPRSAFASANSWGYRVGGTLLYPDLFGGLTLRPRILWSDDVEGSSPIGGGPFREDRKTLTFGLQGEYIKRLKADLSYTTYWGAGQWNLINDRDHLSFSIRYAF